MLPGFRFLLAAILLSVSILVFGLGAAALLRAAHEEFASNPSWRATREVRFARSEETDHPTLAMLRIEPQAEAAKMTDAPIGVSLSEESAPSTEPVAAEPPTAPEAEQPAVATASAPIESTGAAPVESPLAEAPTPADAAPVASTTDDPAVAEEVKATATEDVSQPQSIPSPVTAEATQPEQPNTPPAAETAAPATRLASQGDQSAIVGEVAKVNAKPEHGAAKPHLRAQRAKARRTSARARAPRQQTAAVQQQPVFPLFATQQPPQATPTRTP